VRVENRKKVHHFENFVFAAADNDSEEQSEKIVPGAWRDDLPAYSAAEVAEHNSLSNGVWVFYANGVYDISEFVRQHPGGADKIMMAAGSSIEPFWALYAQHRCDEVYEILEQWRIGNIEVQASASRAEASDDDAMFANEPDRHPAFKVNSPRPFNAEPPPALLVDRFVTPNAIFFVRNHMPVPPRVDAERYRLSIETQDGRCVSLSLDELRRLFRKRIVTATLQCAGNRRSEMSAQRQVRGLKWGTTAISNATWGGVLLSDVLAHFDLATPGELSFKLAHVHFYGADHDGAGTHYAASVPAEKVLRDGGDVLLAYEMNGAPLPPDHGFPLRAVVPGHVGARNVKWLERVVLADAEVDSHWQRKDYKALSPSIDWSVADDQDFADAVSIQELPVTSAICSPPPGAVVDASEQDYVSVQGYAFSGGGRKIIRVDVSANGGRTWHSAKLVRSVHDEDVPLHPHDFGANEADSDAARMVAAAYLASPDSNRYAWTLWSVDLDIDQDNTNDRTVELCVKAIDEAYNSQPDSIDPIWNIRGLLNNAWHRVQISIVHSD
jgi:sulfite oxidase